MGPWAQRSIGAWWPYQVGGTPGAALRRVSPRRGAPTFLPPRPLRGVTCHLPPFLPFLPAWLPRLPTSSLSSCLGQFCTWSRLPCCLSRLPWSPLSLHVPLAPRLSPPLLQALLFGSFFPPGCRSPCRSSEQFLFPIRMTVSLQSLQPPWAPDERPWLAFLPTTHSNCLGCLLPLPSCAAPPPDSSWCAPSSTCLCAPAVL